MFTRACASAYRVAKTRRAIRARGVLVLVLVCAAFTIILNVSLNRRFMESSFPILRTLLHIAENTAICVSFTTLF